MMSSSQTLNKSKVRYTTSFPLPLVIRKQHLLLLDGSQKIKTRTNLCLRVVSLHGGADHGNKPSLRSHLVCVGDQRHIDICQGQQTVCY